MRRSRTRSRSPVLSRRRRGSRDCYDSRQRSRSPRRGQRRSRSRSRDRGYSDRRGGRDRSRSREQRRRPQQQQRPRPRPQQQQQQQQRRTPPTAAAPATDPKLRLLEDDPRRKNGVKIAARRGAGRNTESFDPRSTFVRPDFRVRVASATKGLRTTLKHDDIVIVPELYNDDDDWVRVHSTAPSLPHDGAPSISFSPISSLSCLSLCPVELLRTSGRDARCCGEGRGGG